jgi:thiol:disulfide interchange protein
LFLVGSILLAAIPVRAQTVADPFQPTAEQSGGVIGFFDQSAGQIGTDSVTIETLFTAASNDRPAMLSVTALVAAGKHIYSITQPPGGPQPTRIELAPSREYRLLAPFRAHPLPHKRTEQEIWPGLEIQEHEGEVTWYAPIELTAGVDAARLQIRGQIDMQACEPSGTCEPIHTEFAAALAQNRPAQIPSVDFPGQSARSSPAAAGNPPSAVGGSYQARGSVVKIDGRVEPAKVRPGESARVIITVTPSPSWHVYAYSPRDDNPGSKPTLIAFANTSGLIPNGAITDAQVNVDNSVPEFGPMRYHEGAVTWTARLDVPQDAPAGEYEFNGYLGHQACQTSVDGMGMCEQPQAARFQGTLHVGAETADASAPLLFEPANYREASNVAAVFASYLDSQSPTQPQPQPPENSTNNVPPPVVDTTQDDVPEIRASDAYDLDRLEVSAGGGRLSYYIALAFVGGLILNLMPCVLPVIGLKVMSFVEQAGRSRRHALALNLWYSAGIVSVFLLLGVLACLPQLGLGDRGLDWGSQNGNTAFNVTIASVVFAMALSLLGVWEVPIPGFFGSGTAQDLATKEGPTGAFAKGIVTTVLATPCTAPFMATALAWAVSQPVLTTLTVFASLGIGMASPYVLVGVFPELLRFLPRPGAWMQTFKQVMGFVLLATVVYILTYMEAAAVVPTVALLMGVGAACWVISRTPFTAELRQRLQSWGAALAVVLAFVAVSFGWLYPDVMRPRFAGGQTARAFAEDGPWQSFSLAKLKQLAVDEGRTVLVDFTADWCPNCKVLERFVLHTDEIEKAITQSGTVTMYADWTHYPQEITDTIQALKATGVPVIAVFPGQAPYEPIVFRGGYRKQDILDALEKATGRRLGEDRGDLAEASSTVPPVN